MRRNSNTIANEAKQSLIEALAAIRTADRAAREGRLFAAASVLNTAGTKLAFLFDSQNMDALMELSGSSEEFVPGLRDIRDTYGQAHAGILHGTAPLHRGANPMTNSIGTLMGDIESVYTLLFNSRPPRG